MNLNELKDSMKIKLRFYFDKNMSLFTPESDFAKGIIQGLLECEARYARMSMIPMPLSLTRL